MDKFKLMFYRNKKVFVFLFGLVLIGILFGSSLNVFLSDSDKLLVSDYLANFVSMVNSETNYMFLFMNGLVSNCGFVLIVWLLGISVIGIPIILFMFFSKCFVIGFSISSIIVNYGFKGILFALFYVFPHHIINLLIYGLITGYSLIFSFKFICFILKKNDFNIRITFNRYFKIFLFCFICLLISILYEVFIEPLVLRTVFKLLAL